MKTRSDTRLASKHIHVRGTTTTPNIFLWTCVFCVSSVVAVFADMGFFMLFENGLISFDLIGGPPKVSYGQMVFFVIIPFVATLGGAAGLLLAAWGCRAWWPAFVGVILALLVAAYGVVAWRHDVAEHSFDSSQVLMFAPLIIGGGTIIASVVIVCIAGWFLNLSSRRRQ